jgi:hypothetical protein
MKREKVRQLLIYAAYAFVLVVVVWGLSLVGSPSFNRKLSADRNRIDDLERLRNDIELYFDQQRELPSVLTDLEKLRTYYSYRGNLEDPMTKKAYEYKARDLFSYELCAEFELSSGQAKLEHWRCGRYGRCGRDEAPWKHGVGRHCFSFEIPISNR